jgi:hypothetical protein
MKRLVPFVLAAMLTGAAACLAAEGSVPVTPETFPRAESDLHFSAIVKDAGIGKFKHQRAPAPIEKQRTVHADRDTLDSEAVFDLDAGPVTITLPDGGRRFLSIQAIDEDGYTVTVVYGSGGHVLTKDQIGTRYVLAEIRVFLDASDPKDVETVNALQDAVKVDQPGGPGVFQIPNWDASEQAEIRTGLSVLGLTLPDTKDMFGPRGKTDPVRHLIGSATAWGGVPEDSALVVDATPERNDGKTIYRLSVKDVPVDGFWSISVYNERGFFEPNPQKAYSLTNLTAKADMDGSIAIQFGGCNGKVPNCLPTPPGWNYLVRLYRPRAEILKGRWTFPEPKAVP